MTTLASEAAAPASTYETSTSSGEIFSLPVTSQDEEENDTLWCILSNVLFVSGGVMYITATSWDYSIYAGAPADLDVYTFLGHFAYLLYQGVWIMGPLIYFLNSIVDVKWALLVKRRYARRRRAEKLANPALAGVKERNILKEILRQMRKSVGSRRTLGAASTFGVGAFCGLVAALLGARAANTTLGQDMSDIFSARSDKLGTASVHIYLISAICALWKPVSVWKSAVFALWGSSATDSSVPSPSWYSNPNSLFTLGDILFGTAAIIDVCLTNSSIDDGYLSLPIFSSILWTTDALLYMRGDICVSNMKKIESSIPVNKAPANIAETEIV